MPFCRHDPVCRGIGLPDGVAYRFRVTELTCRAERDAKRLNVIVRQLLSEPQLCGSSLQLFQAVAQHQHMNLRIELLRRHLDPGCVADALAGAFLKSKRLLFRNPPARSSAMQPGSRWRRRSS